MYQSQGNPAAFTGVKPGRYWVQVEPTTGDAYLESVTSGGEDLLRTPLVVPFGASVPPIEITMGRNPGHIEVTIEETNTSPAEGASGGIAASTLVELYEPTQRSFIYCVPLSGDGGAVREASGVQNGKYYVSQVAPGDYRILAFDSPQQLEYRNPAAMRPYESQGRVVHVKAGEEAQVTVRPIASE
jgi:hypothetical protein